MIRYARITEKIISVKKGAAPVVMAGNVYPIVFEDDVTGNLTVLAENREIMIESQFVRILSDTEADAMQKQEVMV